VTQSVISAYESGARQPSVPTLERLVRAAGYELDVTVNEVRPAEPPVARHILEVLARHRREVKDIAAGHGLMNLRLFGSVARGEATGHSDVDLLVDVAPGVGLIELARCQRELEAILGLPIDLVPAGDLKPGAAPEVLAQAQAL
jgi:uncharacterized protein